ncbi:Preprotein translocase subunit SecG [Lactobacillus helveticus CIRM-BIA 951]|uniref:Protein-export membrane protein SecG n=5 Tax=Lactobacillus TaxID=1578 RepID=U4QNC5_LACHE|nr:Preprotein translocase subunit SecG [Lactobacillus helveticus CIRM-BIA 953]CDI58913.1 Preprotein translocase subunit SecG [Lactobacillus helveticus CIRM-BIA 951]CDI60116.1 Preprotein translocase subunit SecG [Lactobacillus helveticus CIRM-BIA 104]CDI63409.1 Preprotein translocase subunit SecG [Lactobacillus helveticus CIRM-BIA 103]
MYVCIGGSALYNLIMTLLIIVSILIVIATMMQPQKQQDALNALSGGAVFSGQTKKRGFEAFMEKVTAVLLVLFFVFAIILAYMSTK